MDKGIFYNAALVIMAFFLASAHGDGVSLSHAETRRVPVKVFSAVKRDVSSTLSAMGTVNYLSKADVSSEFHGILSSVNVEEGDMIQKGQVIAVIDSALLRAQLKQTRAILELAEINKLTSENERRKAELKKDSLKVSMEKLKDFFETQEKLFKIGGITQSKLDKAEMNYRESKTAYEIALEDLQSLKAKSHEGRIEAEARVVKARADVDEIRTKLYKCNIKAPITGIVSSKKKWTGESASPGDSVIVTIIKTKEVYAEAELNEKDMRYVKVGQRAEIRADAYPDMSFQGSIHLISPTVDMQSRTVKVKVKVPNEKYLLKPGMFVRIEIILKEAKNVVAVPPMAIVTGKDGHRLAFVVVDEVAFLRKVQTGLKTDKWVVIARGVEAGEKVVVEGWERLSDLTSVDSTETSLE